MEVPRKWLNRRSQRRSFNCKASKTCWIPSRFHGLKSELHASHQAALSEDGPYMFIAFFVIVHWL